MQPIIRRVGLLLVWIACGVSAAQAQAEATLDGPNVFTALNKFTLGLEANNGQPGGVAIGQGAGAAGSTNVTVGFQAGSLNDGSDSVLVGRHAGYGATSTGQSVFIGHAAGQYAYDSSMAVAIGYLAGRNAPMDPSYHGFGSVIIGHEAGTNGLNNQTATIIGSVAGRNCTNAVSTTIVGWGAGANAPNCRNSVLLGNEAGATLDRNNSLAIEANSTYSDGVSSLVYGEFDTRLIRFNGSVWMGTMPPKPPCNASKRGATWFVQGGQGVADTYEICSKDASNNYAWRSLQTTP